METIKSFPRYLLDNGLLFEINRKVLHPLGLALSIDVDRTNRKQLAITELLFTEDSDGILFDEETYNTGEEKYNKFLNRKGGKEKLEAREKSLGFIVQNSGKES